MWIFLNIKMRDYLEKTGLFWSTIPQSNLSRRHNPICRFLISAVWLLKNTHWIKTAVAYVLGLHERILDTEFIEDKKNDYWFNEDGELCHVVTKTGQMKSSTALFTLSRTLLSDWSNSFLNIFLIAVKLTICSSTAKNVDCIKTASQTLPKQLQSIIYFSGL